MDSDTTKKSQNLFQVFLRLRPPQAGVSVPVERFLTVNQPGEDHTAPTHITLNPPNDRRRAIEKFVFTQVFEEDATQLDVFHCTRIVSLVEGILAPHGGDGTDALLATLGVTGSGKVGDDSRGHRIAAILTFHMTDTHDSGIEIPTRLDTTRSRCHLPVSWQARSRLCFSRRTREISQRLRCF
jgi:hypothetical protein